MCDLFKSMDEEQGMGQNRATTETTIPTQENDLQSLIFRGPNSIFTNQPGPTVFGIGAHACVSLKEMVRLSAGFGAKFKFAKNGDTGERNTHQLNGTRAMEDLSNDIQQRMKDAKIDEGLRIKTSIGYLIFWSDSFLRCFIKQKDNSVWILTVTICPPDGMESSHLYTYVLAMGKSSEDHTPVTEHFMREASELMTGFDYFDGESNMFKRMALGVLVWAADRPERQTLTHTRKEGTYGKVSGWAVNVSEAHLPACRSCFIALVKDMLNGTSNPRQCNKCCNWSFETKPKCIINGEAKNLQENDKPNKDYPAGYTAIESLLGGVDASIIEPLPDSRQCGVDHLGPQKLSTDFILKCVRCAYFGVRCCKWPKSKVDGYLRTCNIKEAVSHYVWKKANDDKLAGVIDAKSAEPTFLTLNDCFARFRYPDLPMHALAHGIGPDVLQLVLNIFSHFHKKTAFFDYANPMVGQIISLRLEHWKLKLLPKAAWVGEHMMGFMRMMAYIFGMFLSDKGIGNTERAKVTTCYLKCFLSSFQSLLSVLMTDKRVDKDVIDRHIKLFMSSAHYLHRFHGTLSTKDNTKADPGQDSTLTKKRKKVGIIGSLNMTQTRNLAAELDISTTGSGKEELKKKISAKKKDDLLDAFERLASVRPTEKTVEDLLVSISKHLDPKLTVPDTDASPKKETLCWNYGNWLSFMANISEQIDYLGSLRWIW